MENNQIKIIKDEYSELKVMYSQLPVGGLEVKADLATNINFIIDELSDIRFKQVNQTLNGRGGIAIAARRQPVGGIGILREHIPR